jgi:hypothetical protein
MGLEDEWPDIARPLHELWPHEVSEEAGFAAEGVVAAPQLIGHVKSDAAWFRELVAQVRAERDEVDMVVGVHVADDDRPNGRWFAVGEQRAQRALPQVEHDGLISELDQV